MCQIVAASQYLNVPTAAIAPRAKGAIDYSSDRVTQQSPYTTTLFAVFTLLMISSSLMCFAEHAAQPDRYLNIPASMW